MPIKVACTNCGNQFSAWEDLIGHAVGCPKCQAQVTVPDPEHPEPIVELNDADDDADDDADEEFRLEPVTERPAVTESDATQPESEAAPPKEAKPAPTEEGSAARPTHCPNCEAKLPPDGMLCNECNFHLLLNRVLDSTIESYEPDTTTGFARWLNQQLEEGETPTSVKYWAFGVGLFLLCIFAFCMGPWVLVPVLLLGAAVGVYFFLSHKSSGDTQAQLVTKGNVALLFVIRAVSFREPEWPFPKLPSYSARGTDFGDDDVANMHNTGEIRALDLEGCPITDAALVHLADWKQLRYLVLTNTQVTPEGVERLAQALRDTWIWS